MAYEFVTAPELERASQSLQTQYGLQGDRLQSAVNRYAEDLNYERYSERSSKGIIPTYFKSLISSTPRVVSDVLKGIPPYTPGDGALDNLLRVGSEKLEDLVPDLWERESIEAAGGPKWGGGMGKTWAALAGRQVPVTATMTAGGLVGAGVGALTGGPDPTDLILSNVGAFMPMAALESGAFLTTSEQLGLDEDLQDKWSKTYGAVSGAIEYVQSLHYVAPYFGKLFGIGTKGATTAAGKTANKAILRPLVRMLGKELGVSALEGMEEVFQGATFNKMLDAAVAEQNARNLEKGLPAIDNEAVQSMKENLAEGFKAGFGLATIMRGPATIRNVKRTIQEGRTPGQALGEKTLKAVEKDASFEETFGTPSEILTEPIGMPEAKQEARKALNLEEWHKRIDSIPEDTGVTVEVKTKDGSKAMPVKGIRASADAWGIDTEGKRNDQLRQEMKDRVDVSLGETPEGPRLISRIADRISQNSKIRGVEGGTLVELIPPSANIAQPAEVSVGLHIEKSLQNVLKKVPSQFADWLLKFEKHTRTPVGEQSPMDSEALMKKALSLGLSDADVEMMRTSILNPEDAATVIPQGFSRAVDNTKRRVLLHSAMMRALSPVVGEQTAELILPTANEIPLDQSLNMEGILTRDQYAKYNDNLEGQLRDYVADIHGEQGQRDLDAEVAGLYNLAPIPLMDGGSKAVTEVPTPANLPWIARQWRKVAPLMPSLNYLQNKYNIRFMGMDRAVFEGHKLEQKAILGLRLAYRLIWKQVPSALRTALPGRYMGELVHWLATDVKQKKALAEQLKVENNREAFVDRIAEVSSITDKTEILQAAKRVVDQRANLYKWFAKNGTLDPERARQKYVPVIRVFLDETGGTGRRLGDWLAEQREKKQKSDLLEGLSDTDIDGLIELGDTISSWERKGFAVPGKNTPFYEFARNTDEAILKDLGQLTNLQDIDDIYIRKMVRKKIFGPMTPSIIAIVNQALGKDGVIQGEDRVTAEKVLSNYLGTIMGTPDSHSRALRDLKIPSITNVTNKMSNRVVEFMNKNPLFEKFPKFQIKPVDESMDGQEALNMTMTFLYASTLGFPFNVVSPVKNLTQSFLAIPAVGMKTWLKGINALFTDKSVIKELQGYDLRPEFPLQEMFELGGRGGRWATVAKGFLSIYRASDLINVYSTAASGIVAWKRLEPHLKRSETAEHLSDQQIIDAIFNQRDPRLNDKEVMKKGMATGLNFKGVISKPIALEIVDLIRRGKGNEAKRGYLQYLVNLSQWRYGAGGTPGYLRNAGWRAALMYTSWSANYIDYLINVFGQKKDGKLDTTLVGRGMTAMGAQFLIASLLAGGGLNTFQWILFGPLPDELKPTGPLIQFAENILQVITGGGEALTAQLMPFVDPKEKKQAWRRVQSDVEDLVDVGFLDKRVLEFLD